MDSAKHKYVRLKKLEPDVRHLQASPHINKEKRRSSAARIVSHCGLGIDESAMPLSGAPGVIGRQYPIPLLIGLHRMLNMQKLGGRICGRWASRASTKLGIGNEHLLPQGRGGFDTDDASVGPGPRDRVCSI
ncbi:hypothetical protein PAAG_03699 [Paracoccidioides lutzii Pb01]|uniref:Uncharacterized protein n=1 Tax=Paracoccidioides lutzii (strain ATCC MYA-826 / Pb01) TaxID=502779 RepID=C1GYV5_PARBA|nr:hypothetical protein PAAG_03699 [Paracoccidioides lutzii Pb01]EEH41778.2 hypothetical protein PAAG_03699 [Paracoccidioides lutzii Pb01]